jgi:hypothetical protein
VAARGRPERRAERVLSAEVGGSVPLKCAAWRSRRNSCAFRKRHRLRRGVACWHSPCGQQGGRADPLCPFRRRRAAGHAFAARAAFAGPGGRHARERRQEPAAASARARAAAARPAVVSALEDPMIMASVDHLPFGLHGVDASAMVEQRFPLSRERPIAGGWLKRRPIGCSRTAIAYGSTWRSTPHVPLSCFTSGADCPGFRGAGGSGRPSRTAAPVVGGLVSCSFLTLLVLPAAYTFWRRRQLERQLAPAGTQHDVSAESSRSRDLGHAGQADQPT